VADEPELPFAHRVLYHDAHLVVADKPHFVPVTPAGRYARSSLLARLKRELGLAQLSPIHRIDRETAGLVVFAVRPQDRNTYQALFREQRVDKVYEAIAPTPKGDHDRGIWGQPWVHRSHICEDEHAFFRMREAPASEGKAPNSQTTLELVAQRGAFGLYRLCPLTGKRHQLRVHMSALGTPIHGDALYPVVRHLPAQAPPTTDPLRLLAKKLAFTDPLSGEKREFQSAFELEWPNAPA
jgi:tRNA pseudouridine32 synthase/23S rRNA pseudouridine746 synthase